MSNINPVFVSVAPNPKDQGLENFSETPKTVEPDRATPRATVCHHKLAYLFLVPNWLQFYEQTHIA